MMIWGVGLNETPFSHVLVLYSTLQTSDSLYNTYMYITYVPVSSFNGIGLQTALVCIVCIVQYNTSITLEMYMYCTRIVHYMYHISASDSYTRVYAEHLPISSASSASD